MALRTWTGRVLSAVLMAALATSALAGGRAKPPVVTITSPADGATFLVGTEITFTATATDRDLSQPIQWTCDTYELIDNVGASISALLPEGSYIITASATDDSGLTGTDSIAIIVSTVLPAYRIPDLELLNGLEFVKLWGEPGSELGIRTAQPGGGVTYEIALAGTGDGKIGIGDDWGLSSDLNLDWDDGLGHATSLAAYRCYEMEVSYLDGPEGSSIKVCLYLNTGLTGVSGFPSSDQTNDTYWECEWIEIAKGGKATLQLDFDLAFADNIIDNKDPHTGGDLRWPDGAWYPINDRDRHELTNIGLQVIDGSGTLGQTITIGLNVTGAPPGDDIPVHVSSVDVAVVEAGVNTFAEAAVIVVDGTGAPVEGATVTVDWSDDVTGTATGVTDATGLATVVSPKLKTRKVIPGSTTFTASVTNVTKDGTVYDPAANIETSGSATP